MSEAIYEADTLEAYETMRPLIDAATRMLLKDGPVVITCDRHREKRSTSANALYWTWLTTLAKHFSRKGNVFTKDDMHDLMRHRFLGYEAKTIGKTEIQPQLKSTAELDTAQMLEFMQKIDSWALDHGCLLPRPEDNEYENYARASQ